MSQKVREGKHQQLGHYGLIKLIVVDTFRNLRIHVLWSKFIDMDRENFIETYTPTPGDTPTSSVEGRERKIKGEEEGVGTEEEEATTSEEKEREIEEERTVE